MGDTIKLVFVYLIALIIIVGGGAMLFAIRLDPPESQSANLSLLVAGTIGSAVTFVFAREAATQATRAAQSSANDATFAATSAMTQGAVNAITPPVAPVAPVFDPNDPALGGHG